MGKACGSIRPVRVSVREWVLELGGDAPGAGAPDTSPPNSNTQLASGRRPHFVGERATRYAWANPGLPCPLSGFPGQNNTALCRIPADFQWILVHPGYPAVDCLSGRTVWSQIGPPCSPRFAGSVGGPICDQTCGKAARRFRANSLPAPPRPSRSLTPSAPCAPIQGVRGG